MYNIIKTKEKWLEF